MARKFPVALAGLIMLAVASSTFSQTKSLMRDDAISVLTLQGGQQQLGRVEVVDVSGQSFARALRVTTTTQPSNEWAVQLAAKTDADVKSGDVVLAHFWMRCVDSMTGEAFTGFVFESSGPEFEKAVEFRAGARGEWTEINIPFKAKRDFRADNSQVCLRVGYEKQTLEIGGLEINNLGPDVKLESLPRTRITYRGREADAEWRKTALANIEKIRKGDLTVRVTDSTGQPIAGGEVRAVLKRHAFNFGTCVDAALLTGDSPDSQRYREIIEENFNCAVFENDMKWPAMANGVSPQTERALAWLRERQINVRGHNLIWPSWKWSPKALADDKDNPVELRRLCAERITSGVRAFSGQLYAWDVVNEPYSNHDLLDALGRDVMIDWFKLAHEADPNCVLFLNDFGIFEGGPSSEHRRHFFDTIKWMKESGAPIGGIGIQSHFGAVLPAPTELLGVLDQFSTFGLPIESTEASFNLDDRQLQAEYVRDYMIALFSHENVRSIMLWGFWEKRHWRPQAALFNADWSARPAWNAWRDLVHDQWMSDLQLRTDDNGVATARGFCGEYEIAVTINGQEIKTRANLSRRGEVVSVKGGAR